jgi:hypothetical protein
MVYTNDHEEICLFSTNSVYMLLMKNKAIPLQAWTGPEGCRRSRLPDFKTIGT